MNTGERNKLLMQGVDPEGEPDEGGIRCARCGCCDLRVTHTIRGPDIVTRHRQCRHCGWKQRTREKVG